MTITIIGTSHIAQESIEEVKQTLLLENPDILAVELDIHRLYALQQPKRHRISLYAIKEVGVKGFLFALLGSWASQKLGKIVGVIPGEEMLTAVKCAKQQGLELALIDQPIDITLKKLSQRLTWNEKWHFVVDIVKALLFRESEMKKLGIDSFDLRKVPSKTIIKKLIATVKERYPNLYSVLIDDRNRFMARKLKHLQVQYPEKHIVAVVGVGHEDDIKRLLRHIDVVARR